MNKELLLCKYSCLVEFISGWNITLVKKWIQILWTFLFATENNLQWMQLITTAFFFFFPFLFFFHLWVGRDPGKPFWSSNMLIRTDCDFQEGNWLPLLGSQYLIKKQNCLDKIGSKWFLPLILWGGFGVLWLMFIYHEMFWSLTLKTEQIPSSTF